MAPVEQERARVEERRRLKPIRGFLLLFVALVVVACSARSAATSVAPVVASASGPTKGELTIYGAASLKSALKFLKASYEAAVPGTTLTIATDSSATLRTQIEQGAPADIFLSADQKNPEALVEAGLTDGPALDFAGSWIWWCDGTVLNVLS